MENYAEILQALADKFGTTVEHLWGVLIKQAEISAIVNSVSILLMVSIVIWCFRLLRDKTIEPEQIEGESHKYPKWDEETAFYAWCIWGTISFVLSFYIFDAMQLIIAGFFNPEYWALHKIMGKL